MTPQEAAEKFYWIKVNEAENLIEIFCDHHMLSTLRTCEAKFMTEHIINLRPMGHKAWSLVFGAWMHSCFELFYNHRKNNDQQQIPVDQFLDYGKKMWAEYKLDAYKDETKYQKIKGLTGALGLLTMYYAYYYSLGVRVIDTEVSFGFDREVPLGEFHIQIGNRLWIVKCFLTGRIDLVVDNGHKIGPVDHKHTMAFRGDEHSKFNPHDGLTGYMFALNSLMSKAFPQYFERGMRCRSGWIYHISGTMPIPKDPTKIPQRFKATPIDKSERQYEEYRLRQITTFSRIADLLFNNGVAQWNTNSCHNIYMSPCEYRPIHEADSTEWVAIINSHYRFVLPWNPLRPEESHIQRDDVLSERALVQLGGLDDER